MATKIDHIQTAVAIVAKLTDATIAQQQHISAIQHLLKEYSEFLSNEVKELQK